jgi:hypothetical protein
LLAKIVTPDTVNFAWHIQVKSISFAWHIQVKKFGAEIDISCTMHPDFVTKSQVCDALPDFVTKSHVCDALSFCTSIQVCLFESICIDI